MARDRNDDRDDRDDDRPRSRRRDNDDPPKKSNIGKILLIVGLCVGIPLLICVGVVGFGLMKVGEFVKDVGGRVQGQMAATSFMQQIESKNTAAAYAQATPGFKSKMTQAQFDKLVADNLVLTTPNTRTNPPFPAPEGKAPNRTMKITYEITPGFNGLDPDDDMDLDATPKTGPKTAKPPKPTKPSKPADPNAKACTVTITLVEQADSTWKVDDFSVSK